MGVKFPTTRLYEALLLFPTACPPCPSQSVIPSRLLPDGGKAQKCCPLLVVFASHHAQRGRMVQAARCSDEQHASPGEQAGGTGHQCQGAGASAV